MTLLESRRSVTVCTVLTHTQIQSTQSLSQKRKDSEVPEVADLEELPVTVLVCAGMRGEAAADRDGAVWEFGCMHTARPPSNMCHATGRTC